MTLFKQYDTSCCSHSSPDATIVESQLWSGNFQAITGLENFTYLQVGSANNGTLDFSSFSTQWAPLKNIKITSFTVRRSNTNTDKDTTEFVLYKTNLDDFNDSRDLFSLSLDDNHTNLTATNLNFSITDRYVLSVKNRIHNNSGNIPQHNAGEVQAYILFNQT